MGPITNTMMIVVLRVRRIISVAVTRLIIIRVVLPGAQPVAGPRLVSVLPVLVATGATTDLQVTLAADLIMNMVVLGEQVVEQMEGIVTDIDIVPVPVPAAAAPTVVGQVGM